MIKAILFDLDGTLLPMDQEVFTKAYFMELVKKLAPFGYAPNMIVDAVWIGTSAMIKNDGSALNEEAFWKKFAYILGDGVLKHKDTLDEFYKNEFEKVKESCGFNAEAAGTVRKLKSMGYKTVLATNPIFPGIAVESRMRWAGLEPGDFEFYTCYENISCCKPSLEYYRAVAERAGCLPEECLMVGNDVGDDIVAENIGMKVFLLTDCVINRENKDVSAYPQGSFPELMAYISQSENA